MLRSLAIGILALGALGANGSCAQTLSKDVQPLTVPFTLGGGVPTADFELNGVKQRLVLDLGGYSTIAIRTDSLPALDVHFTGRSDTWRDATGATHVSRVFTVGKVRVGDFSAINVEGAELQSSFPGGQDGYLGFGLLNRGFLVFDYLKKEMRIYAKYSPQQMKLECDGVTFPISVVNGVVEAKFQTEKGEFIFQIDTGSSESVFRPSAISDPRYSKITSIPFSKFSVGHRDFGRTRLPLREFNAPDVDGVLGTSFLNQKVFCVDIQNSVAGFR